MLLEDEGGGLAGLLDGVWGIAGPRLWSVMIGSWDFMLRAVVAKAVIVSRDIDFILLLVVVRVQRGCYDGVAEDDAKIGRHFLVYSNGGTQISHDLFFYKDICWVLQIIFYAKIHLPRNLNCILLLSSLYIST
jgi:hypothetical protein